MDITVPFVFPGEGAIVFGTLVTPDMPVHGVEVLEQLIGTPHYYARLKREAMLERLRYVHPAGLSFIELMSGQRARHSDTDMPSGTLVSLIGYDEESTWPMAEWIDAEGTTRVTTIDPVIFAEYFVPEL